MPGPTWTPNPDETLSEEEAEHRLLAPFLFGEPDSLGEPGGDALSVHARRLRAWVTMMMGTGWEIGTASPPTALDSTVFLPPELPGASRIDQGLGSFRVLALFQAHLCQIPLFQNRAWLAEIHSDWVLKVCSHLLMAQHIVAAWSRELPGVIPDLGRVLADAALTELWVGRKRVPSKGIPETFAALLQGIAGPNISAPSWIDEIVAQVRSTQRSHLALVLPGAAQRVRERIRTERLGAPPVPFWIGVLHPSWMLEDQAADHRRANEWRKGPSPLRTLMSRLKNQPIHGEEAPAGHFINAPTVAISDGGSRYPEWDVQTGQYRPSYAQIVEEDAPTGPTEAVQRIRDQFLGELYAIRKEFEQLKTEQRWLHGQRDGPELDMTRAVQAAIDLRAGQQPQETIFRRFQKDRRSLCVMALVDLSGSTLGRVLAEEQKAIIFLSEALQALGAPYAFYGFSSEGPLACRFQRIRDWVDDEIEVAKRMGSLLAGGGSRMGAHIRHATHLLQKRPEEHRLLLVLSDGRPEDRDGYRGQYGIADTAMAVRECASKGVHFHCVSLDQKEQKYLPKLFGPNGFTRIPKTERLASDLPKIFRSISWG